jgi:hypothetical protein
LNQIKESNQNKEQDMQIDSKISQKSRNLKEKLTIFNVINFENGLLSFIEETKKILSEQDMQIDKNQKVISLRNVAEYLFEKTYKQKYE